MKKIVFFGIPAHGHTNPTLAIVKELVLKGNRVLYYSYKDFREKIEEAGAEFVSCDDYDSEEKLRKEDSARIGSDLAFSTKILVDTTLALNDKVLQDMEAFKPDCIVADSMALWGKMIALKLGVPFVSSITTFAFNKHSAKVMKQGIKDLFKMFFSMPEISKQIKRLKNKGYPVKSILDIIGSDDNAHAIVYTSSEFQPCSETFPPEFSFVGPLLREAYDKIEKKKDKLIYISMGTVNNDMMPFYKECIATFKNTDYQVIMSVGKMVSMDEFEEIPENISVFPDVDQIAVLKKADAFITHAGMNSVSESLYYEVPLVMLPKTPEQKGVCERVSELGAGIKADMEDTVSLFSSVSEVLNNRAYKENAIKISDGFKKCTGVKGATDKILSVCKK